MRPCAHPCIYFSTNMLNRIIRFSVENKLVIGIFMVLWVIFGIYELTRLPIDAVPDITNNRYKS
jgi:cobalt-zinc-cadmium resistance protein CzcA